MVLTMLTESKDLFGRSLHVVQRSMSFRFFEVIAARNLCKGQVRSVGCRRVPHLDAFPTQVRPTLIANSCSARNPSF